MIIRTEDTTYSFFDECCVGLGTKYHGQYVSARPFPHIVLDDFLSQDVAELCLREFPDESQSHAKYNRPLERGKMEFQPEQLSPAVRSLFRSFNSAPFIGFLEGLTGIEGLIPDPYFVGGGFHQTNQGGRLGIHADFDHHVRLNLERRINVLIYLNKHWKEEYGGSLELWDPAMKGCQARIVPDFNRCVVFNTSSTSFHGNPERVAHPEKAPRRSIALYYYTATWDSSRRSHTTRFQVRPNTEDKAEFKLRANERIAVIVPPLLRRVYRKLAKTTRDSDQYV